MGMKSKPRLKEEKGDVKEAKLEKEATSEDKEEKIVVKKWKGKDWFSILAPRELGAKLLGQTPATDPKSLMGRVLEIGVPELTGDRSKYYMKLSVRINNIESRTCLTVFSGFECMREHLFRMVRKRNQKVENVVDVVTKDGWLLRVKPWAILNGKPSLTVNSRMRNFTTGFFNEFAKENTVNEFVRKVMSTEVQMRIKKEGSKIYPVRFCEIARIRVLNSPEFQAVKTPEAKKKAEKPKKEIKEEAKTEKKEEKAEKKESPKKKESGKKKEKNVKETKKETKKKK